MPKHKKTKSLNTQAETKVFSFISRNFREVLSDVIYTNEKNEVILWNKYTISKNDGKIIVTRKRDDAQFTFNSYKCGLSFCVFDRLDKFHEATQIQEIDRLLSSLVQHQALHRELLGRGNTVYRNIQAAKLNEAKIRYLELSAMRDKYISQANYWQLRGFNNGTIRTTN